MRSDRAAAGPHETAPSLGRDALAGRIQRALAGLEGETGPASAWRRAWLLTAAGRYGEALDACDQAMAGPPLIHASGLMARAMLHRQVALHARAEADDLEALAVLRGSRSSVASVRAAIRVGQVADAVGLGMEDAVLSRRLRVASGAVTTAGSWRQQVRLTWVRGEVAMVRARYTLAARAFAAGAKIAAEQGARRHEAKSLIFLAASRAAIGDRSEGRRLAARGLQLAARCGAIPLMWPAELILAEVDPAQADAHIDRARQMAAGLIATLPEALAAEARRQPPASWLLAEGLADDDAGHLGRLATDA